MPFQIKFTISPPGLCLKAGDYSEIIEKLFNLC